MYSGRVVEVVSDLSHPEVRSPGCPEEPLRRHRKLHDLRDRRRGHLCLPAHPSRGGRPICS